MSLAESMLAGRIQKRKQEARDKYSEMSRLSRLRFATEKEKLQIEAERSALERRHESISRKKAELDTRMVQSGLDSIISEEKDGLHTPQLVDFSKEVSWWQLVGRPWTCFWRVFLILSMAGCVVLGVMVHQMPSLHIVYSAAMAACIPVSICIFFTELARRDVKWWLLMVVYALGGITSIVMTSFVNQCIPALAKEAFCAGFVEEPCKGAVLLIMMIGLPTNKSTFTGLAFGAAVGAGFASIETFAYAYNFGANGMPSTFVLVLRGVLSPLMHTGWTAALGGALWYIRYPHKPRLWGQRALCAIGVFCVMVGCHCFWNAFQTIGYLPLLVWFLIFFYAKKGAREHVYLGKELPL